MVYVKLSKMEEKYVCFQRVQKNKDENEGERERKKGRRRDIEREGEIERGERDRE